MSELVLTYLVFIKLVLEGFSRVHAGTILNA